MKRYAPRRRPPRGRARRQRRGAAALLAPLLTLLVAGCAEQAPPEVAPGAPLRVCLPESDLPRSDRASGSGFDVDVARHLARELGRPLEVLWAPAPNLTDIESSDRDYRPLLQGQCDLMMSVPGQTDIADYGNALELTSPYYGATWEVVPADSLFDWREPFAGKVAVRAHTVGHRAVHAWGLDWTMRPDSGALVEAVENGAADVALIWGPELSALDVERKPDFEPPPALRWNLHMALRAADAELLGGVDAALADIATRDVIDDLLARHRIPHRGPFATVHSLDALNAL